MIAVFDVHYFTDGCASAAAVLFRDYGEAENAFEKRFYLALSYEERGHVLKLMDAIEYVSDPTSWIYLRDGRNLEG